MKKKTRIRRTVTAMLLVLVLPVLSVSAFAEDVIEAAPQVTLPMETPAEEDSAPEEISQEEGSAEESAMYSSAGSFNFDSSLYPYLPDNMNMLRGSMPESEQYEWPRLSDGELERVRKLMASLAAGEIAPYSGPSVANKTDNMTVGVYALDPEDFYGQTFYVILPTQRLSDDQLLSIIAAFDELGIPFDPDTIGPWTCFRPFYSYGATRKMTDEENTRMASIKRQVIHGIIKREDIHPESVCRTVETGLGVFCFYPYRRMTDDELAAFAFAKEDPWPQDPDHMEQIARDFARDVMNLPISMKLTNSERSIDPSTSLVSGYAFYFQPQYSDGQGALTQQEGRPVEVYVWLRERYGKTPVPDILNVQYSTPGSFYWPYFDSESSLDPEEIKAFTEQWLRDHLNLGENPKFHFEKVEVTGFPLVWVECSYGNAILNTSMYLTSDGKDVESISIQLLDFDTSASY